MTDLLPPDPTTRVLPPGISRCYLYDGYHVYTNGSCFSEESDAVAYKVEVDAGSTRRRRRRGKVSRNLMRHVGTVAETTVRGSNDRQP